MDPLLRILQLEDDPVDAELTSELLHEGGLHVEVDRVDTMQAFQDALKSRPYALILADYTVPGMDVLDALQFAKEQYPQIPIVFLSGTLGEDLAIETLKKGATDYVLKQHIGRLVPAVRRALDETAQLARRLEVERDLRIQGAAMEAAANGIVITDTKGRLIWANAAFTRLTGYTLEETVGKNLRFLKSGKHPAELYRQLWGTILGGRMWRGELENRRKDGSTYTEEMIITPVRAGEDGAITHFVATKLNITDRHKAEEQIRELNEELWKQNMALDAERKRWEAVLTSIGDEVWISDAEGNVSLMNVSSLRRPGSRELERQPIGEILRDVEICTPEGKPRPLDESPLSRSLMGEVVRGEEIMRHRTSGELRYRQFTSSPIRDYTGEVRGAVATVRDVTDQRRVQEELRESEKRFRQLADSMPQIVWASRPDGYLDYFNRRWYELTGAREGEGGDGSWLPLVHPDDRKRCLDLWHESMRSGRPYQVEFRFTFSSGAEPRWYLGRALPVRDETGHLQRWYGTCTDIHEVRKTQEALRESEERFRLALESSEIGWWHWDFRSGILEGDAKVKTLLGLAPDAPLSFEAVLEQTHPEDRAALDARASELRAAHGDYAIDFRVGWGKKDYHWLLAKGRSFDDGESRPVRAMGIVLDITDRKRIEEELIAARASAIRAKETAETANTAKDQFLAVLSHELRTPLAPVVAGLNLLERQHPELKDELNVISRNVELEARLIDDLLDLTRIARGKILLEKRHIDLRSLLERVVEICAPDIVTRRLHFGLEVQRRPLMVNADASRLQQVFWNLLKNAIKFTSEDGCVGVRSLVHGGTVVVEVIDSGMGIEPDAIGKIFNAFEQADKKVTRQFGGLGLGLAISRRLVEMHQGTISAESAGKGQGATFRVTLPLAAAVAEPEPSKPSALSRRKLKPARILLVEDHGDTAQMMAALLASSGYEVETAGDVAEGLEAARRGHFDLIISDLGLPDRSGLELMEELRRGGIGVKGIALSGFGREEDVRRSKEAGFLEHLTKPVNFEALEATVDRVVNG